MKTAQEYIDGSDPLERLNAVVMSGSIHASLEVAGLGIVVEPETIDGLLTGRLLVSTPFLDSEYLVTIERTDRPSAWKLPT